MSIVRTFIGLGVLLAAYLVSILSVGRHEKIALIGLAIFFGVLSSLAIVKIERGNSPNDLPNYVYLACMAILIGSNYFYFNQGLLVLIAGFVLIFFLVTIFFSYKNG